MTTIHFETARFETARFETARFETAEVETAEVEVTEGSACEGSACEGPGSAELVAGAARLNPGAWEALVERYGRMVASIARSYGLSPTDAADVSQTVWLRLLEHAGRLRQPERVGGWLATTARNEALRMVRQGKRAAPVDALSFLSLVDGGSDIVPAVEAEERNDGVRAALSTLPGQQRDLLQLLMADPRPSYVEVSARLGIPMGSIGPTRQRSLRALRAKCVAAHISAT